MTKFGTRYEQKTRSEPNPRTDASSAPAVRAFPTNEGEVALLRVNQRIFSPRSFCHSTTASRAASTYNAVPIPAASSHHLGAVVAAPTSRRGTRAAIRNQTGEFLDSSLQGPLFSRRLNFAKFLLLVRSLKHPSTALWHHQPSQFS